MLADDIELSGTANTEDIQRDLARASLVGKVESSAKLEQEPAAQGRIIPITP